MGVPVSVVVPARNEVGYLTDCLDSIQQQDYEGRMETIVVLGSSDDGTVGVVEERSEIDQIAYGADGRAAARNQGASMGEASRLVFVDADTVLEPTYLTKMVTYLEERDLAAASARCRVEGSWRGKLMEWTINHVFPRLRNPILPGFNLVVKAGVFESVGGFPAVGNEDTAFSRLIAREHRVGYHRRRLVSTSGRRFREQGLTGAAAHYLRLDYERLRSEY